jgi:hypothetical protein
MFKPFLVLITLFSLLVSTSALAFEPKSRLGEKRRDQGCLKGSTVKGKDDLEVPASRRVPGTSLTPVRVSRPR